jgi:transcription elongation GreA/GreB family factor
VEGDDYDVGSEDTEVPAQAVEELVEAVAASSGGEDVFVEVGDRVTYYLVDDPNERHSVLIVNSESNPKMGVVNEQTPLAQALLDLSPGDIGELEVAGQRNRQLRVLKVQRQEELLA